VLDRVGDFAGLLRVGEDETMSMALRRGESIGRPLGGAAFMDGIEARLGRDARPKQRGPRAKDC
jgi:putative transposase